MAQISTKPNEALNPGGREIAALNIQRYQKLLTERVDVAQRQTIMNLLAEEQAKIQSLSTRSWIEVELKHATQTIEPNACASNTDVSLGRGQDDGLPKVEAEEQVL